MLEIQTILFIIIGWWLGYLLPYILYSIFLLISLLINLFKKEKEIQSFKPILRIVKRHQIERN